MHRVVPELILENYRRGRYSGEFPAVALFLDLSGFSTLTDALMQQGQHGAEVLAGLMHSVFDPLVESIFDYGGKIVSFAGDGIMALFQIESDQRSIALTALAAAWEIQRRLAENPERKTVYGKFQFSVKIGLAVGTVAWGILRSEDDQNATYYFRGIPVDDSAEAEHQARAGEIIITDEINKLLKDAIQTEPRGSFHKFSGFRFERPTVTPTVFQPIDLDAARIFIPEKIIVQDVRGEFRQIVNLFMRFPDLPNEELYNFFNIVFKLHKKYGGLLNRLDFGDKGCNMLMLWGAPVAYENDIGRALNFILDLQAGVDFPITAGVTYYVAHAGYLGSSMCEDYTCYGWGVNLASRFMMFAPEGHIWIDDRIARRIATRFDIEYVGTQRFKGFSAEQRVNLLKGRRSESELTYHGEFIGRERELARLEEFIQPLLSHNFTGMLLVMGEAGMGKGRLVHEFRLSELFKKSGVLWATCQTDQIIRQSFNPLRSWLMNYLQLSSAANPDVRKQVFEIKVKELIAVTPDVTLAQDLSRLQPALGALLDLHWPNSIYEQLDAEGRYNSTLLALITFIKAESLRQPLVLLIEDMHFIDGDTLNFLSRLKRSILVGEVNYPIAVIATSRPYGSKPPPHGLVDVQLNLAGLKLEEVARQMEILLGGVPAVELVKLVMERSEGNPYFVEQIIRYLQEENLIELSQVGWNKAKRTREFFLPGDIRSLLLARLDQLAHEVKDVVQTASVLGREFALSVLREMNEADDIEHIVADAEQAEIWVFRADDHYLFTHGLLRDAAYTMQMRARRQELHCLAVTALEKIYADELKFHYAELAYHAERAELRRETQHYYQLAGKAAADVYRNSQAIDYFTRALAFTKSDDLQTQFDLLTERVNLFHRAGERLSQVEDLDLLESVAQQMHDNHQMAKVERLRINYCFATGDYLKLLEHAEKVVNLNTPVDVNIALDTYDVWSLGLLRLGRLDRAMGIAQVGLQLAQVSGNHVKEGSITNSMGLIALEQKNPSASKQYLERALSIAREVHDRRLEAQCLNNLGNSAGFIHYDYASAGKYYEQAYAIVNERGDRALQAIALGNLGWSAGMQGDFPAARQYHERALRIAREVGNVYQETYTLINLSAVAGIQQDAQSSLEFAQQAYALSRKVGERSGEAWALLYMGYGYLILDDLEQAEKSFQASILIREELGQPALRTEPLAGLIEIHLKKKDYLSALEEAEKILSHLTNGGTFEGAEEPLRIYLASYLALHHNLDPRANDLLDQAYALLESQMRMIADDEARRMYVGNVPWRRAIDEAWNARRVED